MVFKKKEDFNFNGCGSYDAACQMTVNDLSCMLNMPKAVKSQMNEGKEVAVGLPPYAPRKAFKVDEYECPTNWMHGSAMESSFFVPIEAEHGMWLDFNRCWQHKHHVAIVISVQGINPLTGQSQVEGKPLCLEQYKTKCPKHDVEFGADRFCEKCGYKWVPQNYLATTGTPNGLLWLDGFLAEDGVVRQYYFTEEEAKGVAHQIIGPEKKVYAIGVAFYLSKEPKPVPKYDILRSASWFSPAGYSGEAMYASCHSEDSPKLSMYYDASQNPVSCSTSKGGETKSASLGAARGMKKRSVKLQSCSGNSIQMNDAAPESAELDFDSAEACVKQLEVGAGAKINQKVYADPNGLDFWQDKPAGFVYINYCTVQQAQAILSKGRKDRTAGGEGFLAGLKTGK